MARKAVQRNEPSPTEPIVVREIPLTPDFNKVFFTTVVLTVVFMAISVGLAVAGPDTEEAKRLIETCSTMSKLGFGAILGLLGGKAV